MSPAARRTTLLAVLLAVLIGVDLAWSLRAATVADELPAIEKLNLLEIQRVDVTHDEKTMVFETDGAGGWLITAPFQGPADRASVRAVFTKIIKNVPMEVAIDSGNFDQYGLDGAGVVLVEIYMPGDDGPSRAFYVGDDTTGGASFIRFPDDDTVYRAQIGGRHRYAKRPREWRDRRVVPFVPKAIRAIRFAVPGQPTVTLQREDLGLDHRSRIQTGEWTLGEDADFPIDQTVADGAANLMGGMRAGEILSADHPGGLDRPKVLVTVWPTGQGEPVEVAFGRTPAGTFAQSVDGGSIFRVSDATIPKLVWPREGWYQRKMAGFDLGQVHRMTFTEPLGKRTVLEHDATGHKWHVIYPRNVDANTRDATQAAVKLGRFEADLIASIPADQAGFTNDLYIEIELTDGTKPRFDIGNKVEFDGKIYRYIRTADQPDRVGAVALKRLLPILSAWSR